jgi:SAM-dependent methyltransferase
MVDDPLTLDALTAGVSVFQRAKGHRFSSDDVVTAWVALQVCPDPTRVLDLGCGIGSVLLHVAWSAPRSSLVGVEAQSVSVALRRNVEHNGFGHRVRIFHGDLRPPSWPNWVGRSTHHRYTPYFAVAAATRRWTSNGPTRIGIAVASSRTVVPPRGSWRLDGCRGVRRRRRHRPCDCAALAHGLAVWSCRRSPRAGRPPLFGVWALRHPSGARPAFERELTLLTDGARTDDAGITGIHQLHQLREAGFAVRLVEAGKAAGGTWYWNRYPGARFDSESYSYQYFFSEELLQEWNWSEHFAGQAETEAYLNFAVDKLGLRDDMQFDTRVVSATFEKPAARGP